MKQAGKITHYLDVLFLTDALEKTKDGLVVMMWRLGLKIDMT